MATLPRVDTRISHGGTIGTIRFVGPVDGTRGEWLGVEWDDLHRGKHDGVKDGNRYFSCLVPNSGTFLRPSASGISYGISFLKALSSKYIEALHASTRAEKVILGSSNGAIEVEAVGLDKIRSKLSQLSSLREVSLDNYDVAFADPHGSVLQTCPGIRGLDLSQSLLPSWETVALIVTELPRLERLALNRNRLALPLPSTSALMERAFRNLKELQLNATLTTWSESRVITAYMPALELLELGYNRLRVLAEDNPNVTPAPTPPLQGNHSIRTVNFDGNRLQSWEEISIAMQPLLALERLILSTNELQGIGQPPLSDDGTQRSSSLQNLKTLAVSFNSLRSWADVNNLPRWCPKLEALKITSTERADCERFYLSWINKNEPMDDDETRRTKHPRWLELCKIHGKPDEPPPQSQVKQDTLGSRLFQVTVRQLLHPPPTAGRVTVAALESDAPPRDATTLRVLPTMSIRTFRLKLVKALKLKLSRAQTEEVRLWLVMPDSSLGEIKGETDDLAWWGIEDGSEMVFFVPN
ncbi:hypothetical protein EIP91_010730 [Steccherinum ochraceum]|uniref:CAP-Gly domain-containing protein n=1 Tax=Steccherinum ochraceum TaxID=92696 RepID=A0A4R0RYZ2_9APHY|nr:hypothetical protein EIP91_010730 [Steccherinum ochraceum]